MQVQIPECNSLRIKFASFYTTINSAGYEYLWVDNKTLRQMIYHGYNGTYHF